ncbi:MAG: YihA family ribosome biogenesis GTP-binding protein [bacterium]|nr:YihA family ribosome biogenesis GTP-binding protein [bacterium]
MSRRIVEASFVLSAPTLEHCPEIDRPEIAIAGRSNVGKSSLINTLCNRRGLAKTSSTPGKTRAINYFDIRMEPGELRFYLVDLPGYGYAKVSKAEQKEWGRSMHEFLARRAAIEAIIHLIDIRHDPSVQDVQMREWILQSGLPPVTVFTKADKLSRNQLNQQLAKSKKLLLFGDHERWVVTSAQSRTGLEELSESIAEIIDSAFQRQSD